MGGFFFYPRCSHAAIVINCLYLLQLWEVEEAKPIASLSGHGGVVSCILSCGTLLLSAGHDHTVLVCYVCLHFSHVYVDFCTFISLLSRAILVISPQSMAPL